jgi:hypothetical protein
MMCFYGDKKNISSVRYVMLLLRLIEGLICCGGKNTIVAGGGGKHIIW